MRSNMYYWNLDAEQINNAIMQDSEIQCIYKLHGGDLMLLYIDEKLEPFIANNNSIKHVAELWQKLDPYDKNLILEIMNREILGGNKNMYYLSNPENWTEEISPEQAESLHMECLTDADQMYYVVDFLTGAEVYYLDANTNTYKHIVNVWRDIDPIYRDWIMGDLRDHALDRMENPTAEII